MRKNIIKPRAVASLNNKYFYVIKKNRKKNTKNKLF